MPASSLARLAAPLCVLLSMATAGGSARGEPVSFNTILIANEPLSDATDISATGDLVIVGRGNRGVSILDVTSVENPTVRSTWDHPTANIVVRDARPIGTTLWCSNETDGDFGCFALDISNPSNPTLIGELFSPTFPGRVHNLWPDGTDLYLSGTAAPAGNFILDVSDPESPTVLSRTEREVHDNCVVGDSLYHAAGFDALYFVDVTDPSKPLDIGSYTSTDTDTLYYAHQAYPIPGTPYVFLTEEIQRPIAGSSTPGSTRLVNFTDPESPVCVWRYRSESMKTSPWVGPHNGYVNGEFMYLSHYQDGLKIFDVSVPSDPVEVGFYDTYPDLPGNLFEGCWGVYPFQGPDRIFLSDRAYGFFHVSFNGARRTEISGHVRDASTMLPIEGATFQSLTAARTTATDALGAYTFKTGEGTHQIVVGADGYVPHGEAVTLAPNGSIVRDFLLATTAVSTPDPEPAAELRVALTPNPTGGVATLRFEVPEANDGEPLVVGIHDVSGRLLRRLVEERARSGVRELTWDGRTAAGFLVASGVYVVSTRLGAVNRTERLVVRR